MDISGIPTSAMATGLDQKDTVGVSVLKKAMDIEKQTATQLINAIPEAPKSSPVGSKGHNIDIYA